MKSTLASTLASIFWYTVSGLAMLLTLTCGGAIYHCEATVANSARYEEHSESIRYAARYDTAPPRWSRDGRLIAFSHYRTVYTMAADGSRLRDVTSDDPPKWIWNFDDRLDAAQSPSISPDGTRIAYAAYKHDRWWLPEIEDYQWEIVTSRLDGSGRRRLTKSGSNFSPSWSPDGSRIAFISRRRGVYVMNSDGSDVRVVALGFHTIRSALVWSPDGRRLAFVAMGNAFHLPYELYTVGVDGTGLTRIGEAAGTPSWSPDGGRIAFARSDGDTQTIVTTDPDGANVTKVSEMTAGFLSWSRDGTSVLVSRGAVSPDGSRIVVYSPYATYPQPVLFTMAPDGTDIRALVEYKNNRDGVLVAAQGQ